jgi:hypothetical protein
LRPDIIKHAKYQSINNNCNTSLINGSNHLCKPAYHSAKLLYTMCQRPRDRCWHHATRTLLHANHCPPP